MHSPQTEAEYSEGIWSRILFVILFAFIYSVTEFVLFLVVVVQFGFVIITAKRNEGLLLLGTQLASYIYQMVQYFVFATNDKPFPFGPWPDTKY